MDHNGLVFVQRNLFELYSKVIDYDRLTLWSTALDRSTILGLFVPGFYRQVF